MSEEHFDFHGTDAVLIAQPDSLIERIVRPWDTVSIPVYSIQRFVDTGEITVWQWYAWMRLSLLLLCAERSAGGKSVGGVVLPRDEMGRLLQVHKATLHRNLIEPVRSKAPISLFIPSIERAPAEHLERFTEGRAAGLPKGGLLRYEIAPMPPVHPEDVDEAFLEQHAQNRSVRWIVDQALRSGQAEAEADLPQDRSVETLLRTVLEPALVAVGEADPSVALGLPWVISTSQNALDVLGWEHTSTLVRGLGQSEYVRKARKKTAYLISLLRQEVEQAQARRREAAREAARTSALQNPAPSPKPGAAEAPSTVAGRVSWFLTVLNGRPSAEHVRSILEYIDEQRARPDLLPADRLMVDLLATQAEPVSKRLLGESRAS